MSAQFAGFFASRFGAFLDDVVPRFNFILASVIDETEAGYNVAIFRNNDMRLRLMREQGAYLVYIGAPQIDDWIPLGLVLHALGVPYADVEKNVGRQAQKFSDLYATVARELQPDRYTEFQAHVWSIYKSIVGPRDPWA